MGIALPLLPLTAVECYHTISNEHVPDAGLAFSKRNPRFVRVLIVVDSFCSAAYHCDFSRNAAAPIEKKKSFCVHPCLALRTSVFGTSCGYLDRQQRGRSLVEGLEPARFHQRCPRPHHAGAVHATQARACPVETELNDALVGDVRGNTERHSRQKGNVKKNNADIAALWQSYLQHKEGYETEKTIVFKNETINNLKYS